MKNIAPLLIVLLIFSCKNDRKSNHIDNTFQKEVINGIEYSIIVERSGDCKNPQQEGCVEINIKYPVFKSVPDEVRNTVNNYIKYSIADFLVTEQPIEENNLDEFVLAASAAKESETIAKKKTLKLNCIIDNLYKNDKLISLKNDWNVTENSSANQNGISFFMVDQPEGKVLELADVLSKPDELRIELLNRLKESNKIGEEQDLKDFGFYVSDESFAITDNFGVSENDFYFDYMPEEIAPTEKGILSIKMSKSEISPYLTKSFLNMWTSEIQSAKNTLDS